MKRIIPIALILMAAAPLALPQPQSTAKTNVDEVLLDLVVRDKKGKPIADLKPEEVAITDNGVRQSILSFRLVRGAEAISSTGASAPLDPFRQIRLVTLAFDPLSSPDQRKLSRTAALDLVKGDQGVNVFYSVVVIDTKLMILQRFTKDHEALIKAIMRATEGVGAPRLTAESDAIVAQLKGVLDGSGFNPYSGAIRDVDVLAVVTKTADTLSTGANPPNADAVLAKVTLDMLRSDAAVQANGARMSLDALKALVGGMREMPGRKSILYFTAGMYLPPELDTIFRHLIAEANRDNVTFYSIDTRGVMVSIQNDAAMAQLNAAAAASVNSTATGASSQADVLSSDQAELSGRANLDLALRDLAESTGGFLIGDSNDLRVPLRRVNEEIGSYYEISYNPNIANYDGSFRKLSVASTRKDVVIHSRTGYFALPAAAAAAGLAPFELPLLKILADGKLSEDVKYRAGAVTLQRKKEATSVAILLEVPLAELQTDSTPTSMNIHCTLAALIKDSHGAVLKKITSDRSLRITPEQHAVGRFLDKTVLNLAPGTYTLDSAVLDMQNQMIGAQHAEFTVPAGEGGVGISALLPIRSYVPNSKDLDSEDPFQVEGDSLTPTMDTTIKRVPNSPFRLFFTVYPDPSIDSRPMVAIEITKDGKTMDTAPMQLPAADALGRIPYLMTIPAESIHSGSYQIRATVTQGSASAVSSTTIQFQE